MPHSSVRRACATIIAAGTLVLAGALPAYAAGTLTQAKKLGTVDLRKAAADTKPSAYRPALRNLPAARMLAALEERRAGEDGDALRGAGDELQPPTVAGQPITTSEVQRGFEGQDIRDTVFSQGFELEPPDQGLCGGTYEGVRYLFESVNLSFGLYDTKQNQYTPPGLGLNVLFDVPPIVDLETGAYGPLLSDPKCYFDTATGHWFHSVLEADIDPATGALTGGANTLLAVSGTRDPFGPYTIYAIDATHADCNLCIGDQPLLGADANGIYISTAEYDLAPSEGSSGFFGAQIYAIDKFALIAGRVPNVVHLEPGTQYTGTLQPATTPNGRFERAQYGTEYFMSAQDCEPPDCRIDEDSLENTIHVWALTRTATLRTTQPSVRLFDHTVKSQVYGTPVPQRQRPGFHPLGESHDAPVPAVEGNDARMNQVVYAAGRLWGAVNTIANPGPRDAIGWFVVVPRVWRTGVSAWISRQGYVAGDDPASFVTFPSIGVNDAGRGVIAYSLMGERYYPSAAQSTIGRGGVTSGVQVVRGGFKPEDGFTCYAEEGAGPNCRWGDYSASFAFPNGEVWSATEFIGDNARTFYANWSTFVWPYGP